MTVKLVCLVWQFETSWDSESRSVDSLCGACFAAPTVLVGESEPLFRWHIRIQGWRKMWTPNISPVQLRDVWPNVYNHEKKTSYRIGFKNISLIRFRVTNALFQRHVKRLFCTVFCKDFGGILSIQVSPVIQNKPSRLVLSWLYYIAPMYIYIYIII